MQHNNKDKKDIQKISPFKSTYIRSKEGIDENLLILLHGLGDNEFPYVQLADQMKLPQTACIALRGPLPVPLIEDSFCWIPSIDETTYNWITYSPQRLDEFRKLHEKFNIFFHKLEELGWSPSRIFLLGFSQGASVALDAALHYNKPLGGVICVSGAHFTYSWYTR